MALQPSTFPWSWGASVLLAGILLSGPGCWHQDRWQRSDEFVAQLQCGMSKESIEEVVDEYHGLKLHTPDSGESEWTLVAVRGNTRIKMKLGPGGLYRYRISWIDTIKHVTLLPEIDICNEGIP